jgi:hypothetical protein
VDCARRPALRLRRRRSDGRCGEQLSANRAIIATNSTVNLTASNTCINGSVAAGAVNIANNAGFKWDPNVDRAFLSQNSNTFYRTAFSTCGTAGLRYADTTSAPTYPTYPSDGC